MNNNLSEMSKNILEGRPALWANEEFVELDDNNDMDIEDDLEADVGSVCGVICPFCGMDIYDWSDDDYFQELEEIQDSLFSDPSQYF